MTPLRSLTSPRGCPVTAAANLAVGFASLGIGSTLEQKLASAGLLEGGKVLYVV